MIYPLRNKYIKMNMHRKKKQAKEIHQDDRKQLKIF